MVNKTYKNSTLIKTLIYLSHFFIQMYSIRNLNFPVHAQEIKELPKSDLIVLEFPGQIVCEYTDLDSMVV